MTEVTQAIVELYVPCGAVCIRCGRPVEEGGHPKKTEGERESVREERGRPRRHLRAPRSGAGLTDREEGGTHNLDKVERLADLRSSAPNGRRVSSASAREGCPKEAEGAHEDLGRAKAEGASRRVHDRGGGRGGSWSAPIAAHATTEDDGPERRRLRCLQ
jgi:hypothetical protein